jgi:hypothetical protein
MAERDDLSTNESDILALILRSTANALPGFGGIAAEVVNVMIPKQKLERVVLFARQLKVAMDEIESRIAVIEARIQTPAGSDLLEEAIRQASRAVSQERIARIASVLARGLSDAEFQYDRTKKLMSLIELLTDSELVLLTFYATPLTIGSPWHREMMNLHSELLRPVSNESGRPQSESDRAAVRDAYERKLISEGLLESNAHPRHPTALGRLLLRYAEAPHVTVPQ